MRHAYEADIIDRLKANMDSNEKDVSDRVSTREPALYVDPDRYRREIEHIFRGRALVAGHASQVREPGDFFTTRMLGMSLLVARDEQGRLNAFVNACIHRGAQVEEQACGTRADFICPYHGWSFGLDGRLKHVTDPASFQGIDLTNARLVSIPVGEAHGLVFVRLKPRDDRPLALDLGDLGAQLDYFGFAQHVHFRTITVDLKFNWKIAIDGSLETYHLNFLHRRAAKIFTGMASIFDTYGPHCRFVTAARSIKTLEPADLADARVREQSMLTYHLFPTAFVTAPKDHMFLQYYMPTGLDSCSMTYSLLIPPDSGPDQAEHWEKTWAMGQSVIGEDYGIMESINRAYTAGFNSPAIHGRYEHEVARFHELCDQALAGALPA